MKSLIGAALGLALALGRSFGEELLAPVQAVSLADPGRITAAANGDSGASGLSPDGRFVAFISTASNLASNVNDGVFNVFLRDRQLGKNLLVSMNQASLGGGNADSTSPVVSSNGQFVVFQSGASDLVLNDTNNAQDIFVRDTRRGVTSLVSIRWDGRGAGNLDSFSPAMTPDGRWVAFESGANNLVTNDHNSAVDIFVRDLQTATTVLVSVNAAGTGSGDGNSETPAITPDGRYVLFVSGSTNLVPNCTNYGGAIFVRDLAQSRTYWVSSNLTAFLPPQSQPIALNPLISDDGRYVVFKGVSSLGDTNPAVLFYHDLTSGQTTVIHSNTPMVWVGDTSYLNPSLSSDGRRVAYVAPADTSGNLNVWLWDAQSRSNRLVSVNQTGTGPGNDQSDSVALSANGQRLAFLSAATDLTTNATGNAYQIFVRDFLSGTLQLASRHFDGSSDGQDDMGIPVLSADGSLLVFDTSDHRMIPNDFSQVQNVFLHDLSTGTNDLMSQADPGLYARTAMGNSSAGAVSAHGRFVVFQSQAANLVTNDTHGVGGVYVRDLLTGALQLASMDVLGTSGAAGGDSTAPTVSLDGRYVAFQSDATNLVWGDTNDTTDVFVRDLWRQTNYLVSWNQAGTGPGNDSSDLPTLTADGHFVLFRSWATNLVAPAPPAASPAWFVRDLWTGTTILLPNQTAAGLTVDPMPSPDGTAVFYGTPSAMPTALYQYDLRSQTVTLLTNNPAVPTTNGGLGTPAISSDGHWLAIDYGGGSTYGVVVWDLVARTNLFLPSPPQTNSSTRLFHPSISGDGRLLAVELQRVNSLANPIHQVLVYDLPAGTHTLASVNQTGTGGGNGTSKNPLLTPDGRWVIFQSEATDLGPTKTNALSDLFARDLTAGTTILLSPNFAGTGAGDSLSFGAIISADSRTVVFNSYSSDLVVGDWNNFEDVFVARLPAPASGLPFHPNDWQLTYFGNGTGDSDGDGLTDLALYAGGLVSTNSSSLPRVLTLAPLAGGPVTVFWSAVPGKTYRLQYKNAATDPAWTDLAGDLTATDTTAFKVDATAAAYTQRFYRVVLVQ